MNKSPSVSLRIAGIGGQGVVNLSRTIERAAVRQGLAVSAIERPRSAMRLGPITCDLIFLQEGFAPFIVPGSADAVLGLEPLDGIMNAARLLKQNGTVILNSAETPTINEVVTGARDERRDEWRELIKRRGGRIYCVDAAEQARECCGDPVGANYYLLGALLAAMPEFPLKAEGVRGELQDEPDKLACFEKGLQYC